MLEVFNALWLAGLLEAMESGVTIIDVSHLSDEKTSQFAAQELEKMVSERAGTGTILFDDYRADSKLEDFVSIKLQKRLLQDGVKRLAQRDMKLSKRRQELLLSTTAPLNRSVISALLGAAGNMTSTGATAGAHPV